MNLKNDSLFTGNIVKWASVYNGHSHWYFECILVYTQVSAHFFANLVLNFVSMFTLTHTQTHTHTHIYSHEMHVYRVYITNLNIYITITKICTPHYMSFIERFFFLQNYVWMSFNWNMSLFMIVTNQNTKSGIIFFL